VAPVKKEKTKATIHMAGHESLGDFIFVPRAL
jgi:hypothetical protein